MAHEGETDQTSVDLSEEFHPCEADWKPGRRDFFRSAGAASMGAATVAAGCASSGPDIVTASMDEEAMPEAKSGTALPTASFGEHKITRLISGANPVYGYSHFNRLYSTHMREYHTPQRVVAYLKNLERAGINTFQMSWSERGESDWLQYREAGGNLQLLILSRPNFHEALELAQRAVTKLKPLGMAQHGSRTRQLWLEGKMNETEDYLKQIRGLGVMVGLSVHRPEELAYAEDKGWDVDYYMTALYEMNRTNEEWKQLLGEPPIGEVYLPSDPPKMMETIRQVAKPCLAYKALAAGRLANSPELIRERMEVIYKGLKPADAVILGMYQRYSDQIGENADIVRGILST